ncbi:putative dioxygenase [Pseudomonas straminea]|uniref:Homogentisate 1,2-dioxygenase n=1 Tax=Pseudomonas straminea TaxID=47882 RepID=A0A1I1T4P4_PSEOC|nr:homogentisate 1,2-dioxygenase [Pseudomonas straminea]GLX12680.1 putative dioxygenase [Pseudomonas straminea]SFD51213.1 homogentisate 1,2-dioxygenase [Pseudomonas straminea]
MSRKWISFPLREGEHSRQAHCDFPADTYEREMGREGFFGPVTHLHHKHPPTGWIDWQGPLRPHAFNFNKIPSEHDCPFEAPLTLHNADVRLRVWKTASAMRHLVRNSDGDELLFVHDGAGHLHCDFGHLEYRDGDYLVIPRGTAWRIEPTAPSHFLLVENTDGAYQLPEKGLLGGQAIFDPAVLDHPRIDDTFKAQQDENTWQIRIKRRNQISTVTYPYNPLDAVGWHGDNTVVRVNWRDIRPLMSHRYHLPPSVHTTFVAKGFVVCTFTPRPVESDPGALKVPFFHNNDDYDEVLFYHRGNFFSRDNIEAGMVTLHPCGFPHGPHPKALKKAQTDPATFAEEVAVMIDTRHGLEVTDAAAAVDVVEYVNSWRAPGKES